jgi:hypothetical protein
MHFSFIAEYRDNTPCIVVVSVDIRKNRRALKRNECAAYFENDEKQQRAAELSLPIPNFSKRKKS